MTVCLMVLSRETGRYCAIHFDGLLSAATLREEVYITPAISPSYSVLTLGQPVLTDSLDARRLAGQPLEHALHALEYLLLLLCSQLHTASLALW